MPEILALVGQYGLPVVFVIVLAYAYDRKEKAHEVDRAKWALELKAERDACAAERATWDEERARQFDRERQAGERVSAMLLEAQKQILMAINQAAAMSSAFEQEKKEIRERELRSTGEHRPLPPARRGP